MAGRALMRVAISPTFSYVYPRCWRRVSSPALPLLCALEIIHFMRISVLVFLLKASLQVDTAATAVNTIVFASPLLTPGPRHHHFDPSSPIRPPSAYGLPLFRSHFSLSPRPCSRRPPVSPPFGLCSFPLPYCWSFSFSPFFTSPLCASLSFFTLSRIVNPLSFPSPRTSYFFVSPSLLFCRTIHSHPANSPRATNSAASHAAAGAAEGKRILTSCAVNERVVCPCATAVPEARRAAARLKETNQGSLSTCMRSPGFNLPTSCLVSCRRRRRTVGENTSQNCTSPLHACWQGRSISELAGEQRQTREAYSAAALPPYGRHFFPLRVSTRSPGEQLFSFHKEHVRGQTIKRDIVLESVTGLHANPQLRVDVKQEKEEAAGENEESWRLTEKLQQQVEGIPGRSQKRGEHGNNSSSKQEGLLCHEVHKEQEDQQQELQHPHQHENEQQRQIQARQQQHPQRQQGDEERQKQRAHNSSLVETGSCWTESTNEEREIPTAVSKEASQREQESVRRREKGGEETSDVIDELEAWTLENDEYEREERLRIQGKGMEGILEAAKEKEKRNDSLPEVYIRSARLDVKSDRCRGCGALLQSADPSKPAYVPPALLLGTLGGGAADGRSPSHLATVAAAADRAPGHTATVATTGAGRRGESHCGRVHEQRTEHGSLSPRSANERETLGAVIFREAPATTAASREKNRLPAAKCDCRKAAADAVAPAGELDPRTTGLAERPDKKPLSHLESLHTAQAASGDIREDHLAVAAPVATEKEDTVYDVNVPEAALAFDAADGDPEKIASMAAAAGGVDLHSFAAALAKAFGVAEGEVVEKLSFACDYNDEEADEKELQERNSSTRANGKASGIEEEAGSTSVKEVDIGDGVTDAGDGDTDSGTEDTATEMEWIELKEGNEQTGDNAETDTAKRGVQGLEAAATKAASPAWNSTGGKKRHLGKATPQHTEGTSASSATAQEFSAAKGGGTHCEEGGRSDAREESGVIRPRNSDLPLLLRAFEQDEVLQLATPQQQRQLVCQRCHAIKSGRKFDERQRVGFCGDRLLHPDTFRKLVGSLRTKRCIFLLLVDLLSPEILPALSTLVRVNPLFVGVTKCDLLPGALRGTDRPREADLTGAAAQNFQKLCVPHSGRVKRFVFDLLMKEGGRTLKTLNVKNIFPLSNRSGAGLTRLINAVGKEAIRRKRTVYVIGAANAGKTSFLNNLLSRASGTGPLVPRNKPKAKGETKAIAAACAVPGTTLDFLPVVIDNRWKVVDTPGIFLRGSYPIMLSQEELQVAVPSSSLHRISLRIEENEGVWLGSLARVELLKGRGCFISSFLSRSLSIYPVTSKALQNEAVLKTQRRRLSPASSPDKLETLRPLTPVDFEVSGAGWRNTAADIVVSGLGWISVTGCGTLLVRLWTPKEVLAYQRSPLVLHATRACPPVSFGAVKLMTDQKIKPKCHNTSVHDD